MSHFTVLVIGENPETQLQPFHEYECTGIKDQYVVFVEAEENLNEEFKKHSDVYKTLEEFASDYYGYELVNGKFGHYTNPNSKWDRYKLGGRWTGFFKLKNLPIPELVTYVDSGNGELMERCPKIGSPGLMTPPAKAGYADQCLKSEIDFDYMRNDAGSKAQEEFEFAAKILDGAEPMESWDSVRVRIKNIDEAREFYHAQDRVIRFKTKEVKEKLGWDADPCDYLISKDQYIENARNAAGRTFAVIKDGNWYERGSMGWWGVVSNENGEWAKQYALLIDSIPDDTLLSVYDCHI